MYVRWMGISFHETGNEFWVFSRKLDYRYGPGTLAVIDLYKLKWRCHCASEELN